MTFIWFVLIGVFSLIGEPETLNVAPPNAWTWLLLASIAWDLFPENRWLQR